MLLSPLILRWPSPPDRGISPIGVNGRGANRVAGVFGADNGAPELEVDVESLACVLVGVAVGAGRWVGHVVMIGGGVRWLEWVFTPRCPLWD